MSISLPQDPVMSVDSPHTAIELQDQLALALEARRAGIFDWWMDSGKIHWSPQLELLYGVPPGSFEGSIDDWAKRVVPEDAECVLAEVNAALEHREPRLGYEFRAVLPEGQLRWFRGQARFFYAPDGRPLRMVGINVDIHDRKIAEEALLRSEKLVVAGRLAASIAHEINNPLEAVTNLVYLARRESDSVRQQGYLAAAETELARVSAIASQTLRFHRQSSRPVDCDMQELITGVLRVHQSRINACNIEVRRQHHGRQIITCLDGELRQVISNLLINAIDAMPGGGTLEIRSSEVYFRNSYGPGLRITVADSGCGMNEATAKKVFDAFFTTKGDLGTGLGLWVSREIVERHNGWLRVRSSTKPGVSGTVFAMFLPFESDAPSPEV